MIGVRDKRQLSGMSHHAILIAGPTASGKSALALTLAEWLGGLVINADSMQVYAELRILTARPSPEDVARAPHRLYGYVPMAVGYSVGRWLEDAGPALQDAQAQGRVPIFVGGSGLYFKALLEGLSPIPPVPAELRRAVRQRLRAQGAAALHAELEECDPLSAAAIAPTDPQRLARALEVLEATGRPFSAWLRERREGALVDPARALRLVLWPDREALRARINARVDEMLAAGALDEVRSVAGFELAPALPACRAHGLRPLLSHLRGEIGLDEAADRTKAETRQYAKRQFTWFRHQLPDWEKIAPEDVPQRLSALR